MERLPAWAVVAIGVIFGMIGLFITWQSLATYYGNQFCANPNPPPPQFTCPYPPLPFPFLAWGNPASFTEFGAVVGGLIGLVVAKLRR